MKFLDKIEHLKNFKKKSEIPYGIATKHGDFEFSYTDKILCENEKKQIQRIYNFIPNGYFDFLFLNNGISINWIVFCSFSKNDYGFKNNSYLKLLFEAFDDILDVNNMFAFAYEANGNILYINFQGKVFLLDNSFPEKSYYLASSFEDFMDNVLLGSRYKDLYPEDEDWWNFLKSLNWA